MLPAIALVLSVAGGTWLDVPFVKQPKDGCGPASIWMVMQYWKSATTPTLEEIRRTVLPQEGSGLHARDMERYFTANGFQARSFAGEWDVVGDHLSNGRPVIVALRGSPLHYVVVAGIDSDNGLIYVNDPVSRKLSAMHRGEFEKRWSVTNNWTLLVVPAVPTVAAVYDRRLSLQEQEPNPDLEIASAAFRRDDYRESKYYARRAAKTDPFNPTTTELLATLYLLDENVEAALKYWNRSQQPTLRDVQIDPAPRVDPVILDRALAFSRGSVLSLDEFLLTKRRLDATRLLSNYTFDLSPADGGRFDLRLRAADAGGAHYLGWLRGLPYQTIRPQFTNLAGRTVNLDSLLRWDRQKRRARASMDAPLGSDDSIRFRATADARDEQWDFRGSQFSVRRIDTALTLQSLIRTRGMWTGGLQAGTHRVGYRSALDYDVARWPEHRFVVSGGIRSLIGRDRADRFAKVEPSIQLHWLPRARGSDFETTLRIRAGRATSATPIDERFSLGLDRDSDLLLRAHSSLRDGKKGAGLIGNRYVLLNAETAKILHDFGLARVSAGPFVDIARMSSFFIDAGLVTRLSLGSSFSVAFSLGRDLRSGRTLGFFN